MKAKIEELGPIRESELHYGDVTVVYGPPASGKSLLMKRLFGEYVALNEVVGNVFSTAIALKTIIALTTKRSVLVNLDELVIELTERWIVSNSVKGKVRIEPSLQEIIELTEAEASRSMAELKGKVLKVEVSSPISLDENLEKIESLTEEVKSLAEVFLEALSSGADSLAGFGATTYLSYGRGPLAQLRESFESCFNEICPPKRALSDVLLNNQDPLSLVERVKVPLITMKEGYGGGPLYECLSKAFSFKPHPLSDPGRSIWVLDGALRKYLGKSSIVFIEEPEEQLNAKGQALISAALYKLVSSEESLNVFLSTQSNTVVLTLAYLSETGSGAREASEFMERMGLECEEVVTNKRPNVKFYFIEGSKLVERSPEDVIAKLEGVESVLDY